MTFSFLGRLITEFCYEDEYGLPDNYTFLEFLGSGGYGQVLKCLDSDTRSIVAVKIPKFKVDTKELQILEELKRNNCDCCNIIEFIGSFDTCHGPGLVFEALDISLHDYIFELNLAPLRLCEIRAVIKQMAVALNALKDLGVIHADIKGNNIMLEQCKQPIRVKLIDFGEAMMRDQIKQGTTDLQLLHLRAPELLLGLPFSEAIDMWSLGCVMYNMICCNYLSQPETPYEAMLTLVDLLGMPSDDLLNEAPEATMFFEKTENGTWEIKTQESSESSARSHEDFCLDQLKDVRLEENNMFEAEEREQCVELLKAMLEMDGSKRITPAEVLLHPFITGIKTKQSSGVVTTRTIEVQPALAENRLEQEDDRTTNDQRCPLPPVLPSSLHLEENSMFEGEEREQCVELLKAMLEMDGSKRITPAEVLLHPFITGIKTKQSSGVVTTRTIEVQPALAENRLEQEDDGTTNDQRCPLPPVLPSSLHLEENSMFESEEREQCVELLKAMLEMDGSKRITPAEVLLHPFITGIKTKQSSGVVTTRTIEVQPALAENRLEQEDDRTTNDQCCPLPPVLPSSLERLEENNMFEDQEREQCVELLKAMPEMDGSKRITPAEVLLHPFITGIKTKQSSGVMKTRTIEVQPALAENRLEQEDDRTTDDQRCPLPPVLPSSLEGKETTLIVKKVEERKRKLAEGKTDTPPTVSKTSKIGVRPSTAENMCELGDDRLQAESSRISAPVFKDQETQTEDYKDENKKKKKNVFQRLKGWFRKKFSCFSGKE